MESARRLSPISFTVGASGRRSRCGRSAAPRFPKNMLESELFGHEKGAFSGAVEQRIGRFEEAGGGTISPTRSASCPRAPGQIAARDYRWRVSAHRSGRDLLTNARVLAASNRDPEAEIAAGQASREDPFLPAPTSRRFTFLRCASDRRTSCRWRRTSSGCSRAKIALLRLGDGRPPALPLAR